MVEIIDGGELPNWPDVPGVYIFACAFPGNSDYKLGDILYIGVSDLLRRRISYALGVEGKGAPHGAQAPLLRFQGEGGIVRVFICPLTENLSDKDLEKAVLLEYEKRIGRLPSWNKAGPGPTLASERARTIASSVLDRLNVRQLD
jgi:hypothetical protein